MAVWIHEIFEEIRKEQEAADEEESLKWRKKIEERIDKVPLEPIQPNDRMPPKAKPEEHSVPKKRVVVVGGSRKGSKKASQERKPTLPARRQKTKLDKLIELEGFPPQRSPPFPRRPFWRAEGLGLFKKAKERMEKEFPMPEQPPALPEISRPRTSRFVPRPQDLAEKKVPFYEAPLVVCHKSEPQVATDIADTVTPDDANDLIVTHADWERRLATPRRPKQTETEHTQHSTGTPGILETIKTFATNAWSMVTAKVKKVLWG